ncbi:hypothetical protein COE15_08665 [Bacillus cereus]|nr:hypothetical protein COE15_08665 [Bacillus cereus]
MNRRILRKESLIFILLELNISIEMFNYTVNCFIENFLDNLLLNFRHKNDAEFVCKKVKNIIK